jgi:transcriptional regulator with XRE-family HTH domain
MKNIENSECLVGFGKFLKEARLKRDMYQREVAHLAGIGQEYYSRIELGKRNVDFILAVKLCKILRVDINDFIKQHM